MINFVERDRSGIYIWKGERVYLCDTCKREKERERKGVDVLQKEMG